MIRQKSILYSLMFVYGLMMSSLLVSCDSSDSQKDACRSDYLAVQFDEDDRWSIIDADGKVIIDRAYDKDDEVSRIYDDGIYWVYSKGKYRLYSIDSPKKSLTDKNYDRVTEFSEGRAFVSIYGQPIILIDEKGNQIKTLSKDVAIVWDIQDGMAAFQNQDGLWGFLDKSGNVAIPAQYKDVNSFSCGVSFVSSREDEKTVILIDKKGKIIKTWNKDRYSPWSNASEDKIGMVFDKKSDNPSVVYLDLDGNEVFSKVKGYSRPQEFQGGYAVVYDYNNLDQAVINDKGEKVIRGGKYEEITNMGNGTFIVEKDGKFGVVDAEENTLVNFDYDFGMLFGIGDNYIMKSGNYCVIVKPNGEEIKKTDFRNFSYYMLYAYAEYIDLQEAANMLTQNISANGLVLSNGQEDVVSIAKALNADIDSCETLDNSLINTLSKGKWKVTTEIIFDDNIKSEMFHEELIHNDYYEYMKYVSDGYQWNPNAKLWCVEISMELPARFHNSFIIMLEEIMKSKGFKENSDECYYYCGSGNDEIRVRIFNSETDNSFMLKFMTNRAYFKYL